MSSTVSSAAATATAGCSVLLYDIPTKDAACALSYSKNHTDIAIACCGKADVVSYRSDCGLYCLAIDQTVADLTKCFLKEGAGNADVFCNANSTAAATATASGNGDVAATASASVIHSAGSKSSDASKSGSSDSADSTASSSSSSSASASSKGNAAAGVQPQPFVSTIGVVIGALLFSATAIGAFQI